MGAVPGTYVHTADNAVPPLDEEHAGLDDDLSGVHAGVDLIRDGLRLISLERLTCDQTQTLLGTLAGGDGTDVLGLLTATVARLLRAETNPCLRELDADTQNNLARMAEAFAFDMDSYAPRDLPAEAAPLIDPYARRAAARRRAARAADQD